MPNFWHDFWNFFHRPKIKTVEVVIYDQRSEDITIQRTRSFKIKEGSHGSHH